MNKLLLALLCCLFVSKSAASPPLWVDFESKGELELFCKNKFAEFQRHILEIQNQNSVILKIEKALTQFRNQLTPYTLLSRVSKFESTRSESKYCDTQLSAADTLVFSDKKLFAWVKQDKSDEPLVVRLRRVYLEQFEAEGADLTEEQILKIKKIREDLSDLYNTYFANLRANPIHITLNKSELIDVPKLILDKLNFDENENTKISNYFLTEDLLKWIKDPTTRLKVLSGQVQWGGQDNLAVLKSIVDKRAELAMTMNFSNYVDYGSQASMLKSKVEIDGFLKDYSARVTPAYMQIMNELSAYKMRDYPQSPELNQWDLNYYFNQRSLAEYQYDESLASEFFPLDHVFTEIVKLTSEQFGLAIVETNKCEKWDQKVRCFDVYDSTNKGRLSAHFFMVTSTGVQAGSLRFRSEREIPVSILFVGDGAPKKDMPVLLNYRTLRRTIHEFGHVLHMSLSSNPYSSLAATNVEDDFGEAPAIMLEYWLDRPEILKKVSGHYLDTNKKLSDEVIKKIIKVNRDIQTFSQIRDLTFSIFDIAIHSQNIPSRYDVYFQDVFSSVWKIPTLQENYFPSAFSHLAMDWYAGRYYTYQWGDSLAAKFYEKFEANGFSLKIGKKFRNEVYEKGASERADIMVSRFLN